MENAPQAPVPSMFRALFRYLKERRGLDLYSRINFTTGFNVGGTTITPAIAAKLVALVAEPEAPVPDEKPQTARSSRRKTVAPSEPEQPPITTEAEI